MADAAVGFLLNNLKDLLSHHADLISGKKEEILELEKHLRLFNAFLKDSQKKQRNGDEVAQVLVREIRDVAYELEDIIDAYVTQAGEKTQAPFFYFWEPALKLHDIATKIQKVKVNVEQAKKDLASIRADDKDNNRKPEIRPPRERDVVGFADVTKELIRQLTEETKCFEVVSLIGMCGLGKTTLAWKIFNDRQIVDHFAVRIWLSISQEFSDKEIFLEILKMFIPIDKDISELSDWEIARMVADKLKEGKFLIVMDDVWSPGDWDRLSHAIPKDNQNCKVLITSRIEKVGKYASNPKPFKKLRFFTEEESWELLKQEALRKRSDYPNELETIGKIIGQHCGNLPLTIVVIGGILATNYLNLDQIAMKKGWLEVSTQVGKFIEEEDMLKRVDKFISLSYDVLPYHLRACFLYLGIFREDYEIPVSKLVRMWVGEGFIQEDNARTLEETGEMYLEDLINRNLVTVEKFKSNGKVKTCRVHDTLRDFSRSKAGDENENFLQEIKFLQGKFVPPVDGIHKYRHLSVHSNCLEFIASKPFGPRVRSFVCLPKEGFTLPAENTGDILAAFKLVRVLDVEQIKFTNLSSEMYELVHARYLALSLNSPALPSKFSGLWNMQTLIVDTTARTLKVDADIWRLTRLRHFKTKASATLPNPSEGSTHGAELQTLGIVSVESCTAELLEWACNLKKLAIRGKLKALLEGKVGSFATLGKMRSLEKLKLVNDVYPEAASKGKLSGLPQPYQFPSNLKSLTLVSINLNWDFMIILGLLQNLEVLKLKEKAFVGSTWTTGDGGFPSLEFLQIEETDLSVWEASSHHFPSLKGVVFKNCDKLVEIPIGLADIASLQKLELFHCNSAGASAMEIQQAKLVAKGSAFKLSIYPPIK